VCLHNPGQATHARTIVVGFRHPSKPLPAWCQNGVAVAIRVLYYYGVRREFPRNSRAERLGSVGARSFRQDLVGAQT
jgi:hypothetical protein